MTNYPFRLIDASNDSPLANPSLLLHRPFNQFKGSLTDEARHYVPGQRLETAINTAIAVGEPLLITGEPGTGKTQAAYYTAFKLGVGPLCHFQVKSDTVARDLLYHFDNVRYFHDAQFAKESKLQKADYVEKRPLWTAFESTLPQVLLIDEIDKAPRDFPNDLLHELDQMEFRVPETGQVIKASPETRPIVFITSNSERRLPEPFLRRCVYHHVKFDEELIRKAVEARRDRFASLSDGFLETALRRFLELRSRPLRKIPSTGEYLVWLRVLAVAAGTSPDELNQDISKLPHLGVLLKDHQDLADVTRAGSRR